MISLSLNDMKDVAKVFVKNEKSGKYLFQLKDDKPDISNPNCYGLLGGNIEEGESPLEALRRELKEECTVEVFDVEELGNKILKGVLRGEVCENRFYTFLAKTRDDINEVALYEGQKLEYFTIEEALQLDNLSLPAREALNEYRGSLS